MSSIYSVPLSVALYNADGSFRSPYYLVTIELAAFGGNPAKTLRLGSPAYTGPDGTYWPDGVLEVGQMNASGEWLTSKWNPADLDVTLADKRMTGQAIAETFHDYFPDYEFVGAMVHVQIAFENTISTADYRTIFRGRIAEWRQMDATSVEFYCEQDRNWSKSIPPNKLNLTDYPYAPTDNAGVPRPILLGDWETGVKSIPGAGAADETWKAGVMRAMFPTLMVELESAAGAATSPKVMASDKDMLANPEGLAYFEGQLGVMAHSFAALTVTGSGPVIAQLADYKFAAAVIPIEIDATTTANNAQELIRKDKDYKLTGRATLDYNAGRRIIRMLMPDVSELGTFVDAYAYIWFNKPTTSGTHPQWGVENSGAPPDNLVAFGGTATSPTSGDTPHDSAEMHIGPTALGGSNTIQSWGDIANTKFLVEVRNAAETLDVHRVALLIIYKPSGRVITPGTTRTVSRLNNDGRTWALGGSTPDTGKAFRWGRRGVTSPDVTSFDSALYAYGTGVPDSGHSSGAANGIYTGTSGALIEHPCDIAHWALRELGGVSSGEVVTMSGDFGSFIDARATLAGYKLKCQIAEDQTVEEFLEEIGEQTLTWFYRRTTDPAAPFVAIPWAVGASQNYRESSDLVNFTAAGAFVVRDTLRVDRTALGSVANVVRVNFDYDSRTRAYAEQIYITPDGSRVYSGGAYTTDGARVTLATTSATLYGRKDVTLNLKWVRDPATASSILTRLFDWRYYPRVVLKFNTFLNALDLERGHVLRMGSDWDSFLTYPKAGGNGSWASKNLQVFSVVKLRELPVQYAVTAIET